MRRPSDKERLDWLALHCSGMFRVFLAGPKMVGERRFWPVDATDAGPEVELRAAIDKAMRAARGK